ncbi:MAG: baseplate J/gp47 family protein [Thauera sp.]
MSFRRKTYPEVAESLLNRLLGGVSGEAHPYPPAKATREPYRHALERPPVDRITAVWGAHNGETFRFAPDADYLLSADGAELEWKAGGARPDEGTAFEVHYLPRQREMRVNDLYPGSVVRTLMEAVALETASLYAQMETVYRAGFLETASGGALDHVVGLLGIRRVRAGRNSGELRFTRARNTAGEITIPAGTRVATADGAIEYETTADLTLVDGQPAAKVAARDLVADNDGLPPDSLVLMVRPIAGIESVTNPGATARLDRDENDDELRSRARRFLAGSARGTRSALESAIAAEGLRAEIEEPSPGLVRVTLQGVPGPDQFARIRKAVDQVRPAGVKVDILTGEAPLKIDLDLHLVSATGLPETRLRALQDEIRSRYADYFARLPLAADGSLSRLAGLAIGVDGVEDVRIRTATADGTPVLDVAGGLLTLGGKTAELGELRIVDPALATGLTLAVRYPRGEPIPDQAKLAAAVEAAIASLNLLADDAKRVLGWGRLTRLLPLPHAGWTSTSFEAQLAGAAGASAGDVGLYTVQWVFTRPNALSQVLESADAPSFALATGERLSLAGVSVEVKPKAA